MPLLSDNDVNLDNDALNVSFNPQVPPPGSQCQKFALFKSQCQSHSQILTKLSLSLKLNLVNSK